MLGNQLALQVSPFANKPPLRVLCVGANLTAYGAPRVQLTLLAALERTLILPEVYYLRDEGGLSELVCSDLSIRFGVKFPQRARNHDLKFLVH